MVLVSAEFDTETQPDLGPPVDHAPATATAAEPFSALSVIARCEMDDVLRGTFPDDHDGLQAALTCARDTVLSHDVPHSWQIDSKQILLASVVRGTPDVVTPLFNVINRGQRITVEAPDAA